MTPLSRLLVAVTAVALSVASCGQKGPLELPEDGAGAAADARVPAVLRVAQGRAACGVLPHV